MAVKVKRTGGGIAQLQKALKTSRGIGLNLVIADPQAARYASYIEHGWAQVATPKQARYLRAVSGGIPIKAGTLLINPPRPVFGSTFAAHRKEWQNLFRRAVRKHGIAGTEQALREMGAQAVRDIRETIDTGGESSGAHFDERAPLTRAILANKGRDASDFPLVETGTLRNSIKYRITRK